MGRGPRRTLQRFPLGCRWTREGRSVAVDGRCPAPTRPGCTAEHPPGPPHTGNKNLTTHPCCTTRNGFLTPATFPLLTPLPPSPPTARHQVCTVVWTSECGRYSPCAHSPSASHESHHRVRWGQTGKFMGNLLHPARLPVSAGGACACAFEHKFPFSKYVSYARKRHARGHALTSAQRHTRS